VRVDANDKSVEVREIEGKIGDRGNIFRERQSQSFDHSVLMDGSQEG
jgi:hypothetical protein